MISPNHCMLLSMTDCYKFMISVKLYSPIPNVFRKAAHKYIVQWFYIVCMCHDRTLFLHNGLTPCVCRDSTIFFQKVSHSV